jgi:hypothetical protein
MMEMKKRQPDSESALPRVLLSSLGLYHSEPQKGSASRFS